MIRQKSGPWTSVFNDDQFVASCVLREFSKLGELKTDQIRWVLLGEFHDRVLAYEIYPHFSNFSTVGGLKGSILRLLNHQVSKLGVRIDRDSYRPLKGDELRVLYMQILVSCQ